jgi:general secretion pathway protein C
MSFGIQNFKRQLQDRSWLTALMPFVMVVLILYLCWKLASLFWLLIAPPQVMQIEPVYLGSQQTQLPNISHFALFYEQGQSAAQSNDQLVMSLQGVMQANPRQYSSAVIKIAEKTDRYRLGETIEGTNYQLADVAWNHVVLKQNTGATRMLEFPGIANGLDHSQLDSLSTNQINTNRATVNTVDQHLGQATQQLEQQREQYLQNMGVQQVGQGYEISQKTPLALRQRLGLQPGDRILSLNGQHPSAGQTEAQLLEQARQQGQVRLEIQRGDQVMTVQQDFK